MAACPIKLYTFSVLSSLHTDVVFQVEGTCSFKPRVRKEPGGKARSFFFGWECMHAQLGKSSSNELQAATGTGLSWLIPDFHVGYYQHMVSFHISAECC